MSEELPPGAVPLPQASDEEVTSLVRAAIESSRLTTRKVEDGTPQPGVTVDLTHNNIARLPDEAIDLMKMEIERLAISHNRLITFPLKLVECSRLRYLNVRYNSLKEVPKAILKLEALEILDLSRNRIRVLPEEIGNLKALKVLAISRNRIQRLPLSLGDLPRLQLLKFDENPLIFPPPEAYALTSGLLAESAKLTSMNEQESLMTMAVKKYLKAAKKGSKDLFGKVKTQAADKPYSDRDAPFDSAETPRASTRNRSRFPVRVSKSTTDLSTPVITSPQDAPPLPNIPSMYQQPAANRSQPSSFSRPLASRGSYDPSMRPADLLTPTSSIGSSMTAYSLSAMSTGSEATNKSDHRKQSVLTPRAAPSSASSFPSGLASPATAAPQKTSFLVGTEGSVIRQFEPGYSDYPDNMNSTMNPTRFVDQEMQANMKAILDQMAYMLNQVLMVLEWIYRKVDVCLEMTDERRHKVRTDTKIVVNWINTFCGQIKELDKRYAGMPGSPAVHENRKKDLARMVFRAFNSVPQIAGFAQIYDADIVKLGRPERSNNENVERMRTHTMHVRYTRFLQYLRDEMVSLRALIESFGPPAGSGPPRGIVRPLQRRPDMPRGMSVDTSMNTSRPATAQGPGSVTLSSPSSSVQTLIFETTNPSHARFPTSPVDSQTSGDFSASQSFTKRGPSVEDVHFNKIIANIRKLIHLCMEGHGNGNPLVNVRDFFIRMQQESMSVPTNDLRAPERFQNLAKQCHDFARDLEKISANVAHMTDATRMNAEFLFLVKSIINMYTDIMMSSRDLFGNNNKNIPSDVKKEMKGILTACKEVTAAIQESPWAWIMTHQAGQSATSGTYPTTPMGAALGPAAAAAAPRSNNPGRSFNDRYTQYASNQNRRY